MTLIMNYCYRIYPDANQEETMLHWLEISRKVYNYALREIKDWVNSRKCSWDYCSRFERIHHSSRQAIPYLLRSTERTSQSEENVLVVGRSPFSSSANYYS
jgi:putative transposase